MRGGGGEASEGLRWRSHGPGEGRRVARGLHLVRVLRHCGRRWAHCLHTDITTSEAMML